MGMDVIVKSKIPNLTRELRQDLSAVVRKAAFDIEGQAKVAAPVDTGALRASIYVAMRGETDYAQSAAEAQAKQAGVVLFPANAPGEDLAAHVAVGASYAAPVEFKRPFLLPAVERVRGPLMAAIKAVLEKAR